MMKRCPNAIAMLCGMHPNTGPYGQVKFYQKENAVLISINIQGLPATETGFFGFHIHEGDNCGGPDFSGTGSHYNPDKTPHPLHAGDLPPLIRSNGGAHQCVSTDRFTVSEIIGRTVVIHDRPDDFHTQPAGNAGTKIACGVICRV
ncbi:MAG: superoxide dismutase family protein [Ruminococcaceae bacterium]|nr:superoxide dismutase family protein [Oscillospiraceae bacterium]